MSALCFKARVDFSLACTLFLRFISGATPADCIEVCNIIDIVDF